MDSACTIIFQIHRFTDPDILVTLLNANVNRILSLTWQTGVFIKYRLHYIIYRHCVASIQILFQSNKIMFAVKLDGMSKDYIMQVTSME